MPLPLPSSKLIEELRQGRTVLLLDDSGSTPMAYLLCAAASVTAEDICFMVNNGGGVVCAALSETYIKELALPLMAIKRGEQSPDFTISVEARQGVTTGISAADRARTLRTLAKTKSPKLDLVTPGHIFPIRAMEGGVLVRSAIAEAAVDLLKLSGVTPVAALCHCIDKEGNLANEERIESLLKKTGICSIAISDIIKHRLASESIIERIGEATLPTREAGEFTAYCYRSQTDQAEHLALVKGSIDCKTTEGLQLPLLTRVQAEHRIGDLLGTPSPGNRAQLKAALARISAEKRGVLIYIRRPHEGRLAVVNKHKFPGVSELSAKPAQKGEGLDPTPTRKIPNPNSHIREYGIGSQILGDLGAKRIRLLSNSTRDTSGIAAFQIEIVERLSF